MLKKILLLSVTLCLLLCSCDDNSQISTDDTRSAEVNGTQADPNLPEGEDMGQEYIDSFVFLGESTTAHLKNRGVLSGGSQTKQVWSTKSGTLMLDRTTAECRIVYPESGEELDLYQAALRKKPEYMLLTFGLNGAAVNVRRGAEYFKGCYSSLIDTISSASPNTVILLGSCFPVARNMDMSRHSVSAGELNEYIKILNSWTLELAGERRLGYLNTAEVLCDTEGYLFDSYQAGDGYHLTREAYIEILKYIRTHPWVNKEKL